MSKIARGFLLIVFVPFMASSYADGPDRELEGPGPDANSLRCVRPGTIPPNYWLRRVNPGGYDLQGGVIQHHLDGNKAFAPDPTARIRLGLPPAALMALPPTQTGTSERQARERASRLIEWTIQHEFPDLPKYRQTELIKRSEIAAAESRTAIRGLSSRSSSDETAIARKKIISVMSRLNLQGVQAYRGLTELQIQRFGRPLSEKELSSASEALQLAKSRRSARSESAGFLRVGTTARPRAGEVLEQMVEHGSPGLPVYKTYLSAEGGPTYFAYEGRVYVAEHAAIDQIQALWDDMGLGPSPPHTSVVAGYWVMGRQSYLRERRRFDPPPAAGVYESQQSAAQRAIGVVVNRERIVKRVGHFTTLAWINGASGTYGGDDVFTESLRVGSTDFGDVVRSLNAFTPDNEDGYCRNRATAYSLGNYLINWICHQTANAFLNKRFSVEPVFHWYSYVLFGVMGNFPAGDGTSDCDTLWADAMPGCIPGAYCIGNHTPYGLPVGLELVATGTGWGLDLVWKQSKQKWIWSEAIYISDQPNFVMPDDREFTESTQSLPL